MMASHSQQLDQQPSAWQAAAGRVLEPFAQGLSVDQRQDALWVLGLSEFARQIAARDSEWLGAAIGANEFAAPPVLAELTAGLQRECAAAQDMAQLQQGLRLHRNRCQFAVVWRHLLGLAPLEETTATLSALADACIDAALQRVSTWEFARTGTPLDDAGQPQQLVVLALGKLGANELNLSSDVDLIFFFAHSGVTDRDFTHQQIFTRVGQRLIEALDRRTPDGFVFRVDMRLRPYGDSGPLAMSFSAAEAYFTTAGRDWERYAFIKARACAGDLVAGHQLLASLRGFVYRRYLDFGALHALRDMKQRLLSERHDQLDLKLGPGGIRDAEFAVQLQQLIWGGREPALQRSALLQVLPQLVQLQLMVADEADKLQQGYRFLRDTEHCLQAFADEQTQSLPSRDSDRLRLALAMGYADVVSFDTQLAHHRAAVSACFADLVSLPSSQEGSTQAIAWQSQLTLDALSAVGLQDSAAALTRLQALQTAAQRASVANEGRQRLDALMPLLLQQLGQLPTPDASLAAVLPILQVVLRRSAYLVLLSENPAALTRLLELCGRSRWLASQVQRTPLFLDTLLDERLQQALPSAAVLAQELQQQLSVPVPAGEEQPPLDVEQWLNRLREFKEQHGFQAALGQVRGTVPLMQTSNYLTYVAQAVLAQALALAWQELHGKAQQPPVPLTADRVAGFVPQGFVILGFGKLGGIELGPNSDLDIVFLQSLGVEHNQFLSRLVRRLLSHLGLPTATGPLFEIDTRLRPSGRAGAMVTNLTAMQRYYQNSAWTWEHQALVRARPVAGDPNLAAQFAQFRVSVLTQQRPLAQLREDVVSMRNRMLAQQGGGVPDLKRAPGGIVDIEFMVQYLVLAHAHRHPELAQFTDNVRILESVQAARLLPAGVADELRDAYLALRTESHRSDLDLPDTQRTLAVLREHRQRVRGAWQYLFERGTQ